MKPKSCPSREVRDSKLRSAILQGQPCNAAMFEPQIGTRNTCALARFAQAVAQWWSQNHRALRCEGMQRRHCLADAATDAHPRMIIDDLVRCSQSNRAAMGMNGFLQQCDDLFG